MLLATKREIDTSEATVTANVGLVAGARSLDLKVELVARMPGVERDLADKLVSRAHQVCPYSNATRGNVPVELRVEDA